MLKFAELLESQNSGFLIFRYWKGWKIKKKLKPFKTSQAYKSVTFQAILIKAQYFLLFHWKINPLIKN